jgi:hypothetical protein
MTRETPHTPEGEKPEGIKFPEGKAKPGGGKARTDGARRPAALKTKPKEPAEPLPEETQPAPDLPQPKRTKANYTIDDIIADDSDEDEYSEAAPVIPKLVDKLPKAKYIQIRGGKDSQAQLYSIKLDEEDQRPGELNSYILTKLMRDYFVNELDFKVIKMNVCDVCTIQGHQFLYMYPAASGFSNNSWNISRSRMLEAATRGWIIVSTNMELREYTYRTRRAHLTPVKPVYPPQPNQGAGFQSGAGQPLDRFAEPSDR